MHALRSAFAAAAIAAIACATAGASPTTLTVKLYAQNGRAKPARRRLTRFRAASRSSSGWPAVKTARSPSIYTRVLVDAEPGTQICLTNIVHGSSTTTLPGITLADLLEGQYVIDVHESSADLTKYVACAAIALPK